MKWRTALSRSAGRSEVGGESREERGEGEERRGGELGAGDTDRNTEETEQNWRAGARALVPTVLTVGVVDVDNGAHDVGARRHAERQRLHREGTKLRRMDVSKKLVKGARDARRGTSCAGHE